MTSVQERLKLKRAPTDIWSIREQLCLASSVLKSGDQNWMSVSRSLKPIADRNSTRQPDWFSQKSCAQQYAYLLENADIPKRKKRESGETTSESIVRRLTQDRITEITKIMSTQRDEYQQLKNQIYLLKSTALSDEKLKKMSLDMEEEDREEEKMKQSQITWLLKQSQVMQTSNLQKKGSRDSAIESEDINNEEEDEKNKSGKSSLLTNLLKSPSPTTQLQGQSQLTTSPTIASLLCSSPKISGIATIQSSPIISADRSITSAPTLSMLLEAGAQKTLPQQPTSLATCESLTKPLDTRSTQEQLPEAIQSTSDLTTIEIPRIIVNPIDQVMPKVMQMDRDEINEFIGDIEELIKEGITDSPQTVESTCSLGETNDISSNGVFKEIDRPEPRNVDESASLSNSPTSEISIGEIDSSSSNIAEIIGTAIETLRSKVDQSSQFGRRETVLDNSTELFISKKHDKEANEVDSQNNLSKQDEQNKDEKTEEIHGKEQDISGISVSDEKNRDEKLTNIVEIKQNITKEEESLSINCNSSSNDPCNVNSAEKIQNNKMQGNSLGVTIADEEDIDYLHTQEKSLQDTNYVSATMSDESTTNTKSVEEHLETRSQKAEDMVQETEKKEQMNVLEEESTKIEEKNELDTGNSDEKPYSKQSQNEKTGETTVKKWSSVTVSEACDGKRELYSEITLKKEEEGEEEKERVEKREEIGNKEDEEVEGRRGEEEQEEKQEGEGKEKRGEDSSEKEDNVIESQIPIEKNEVKEELKIEPKQENEEENDMSCQGIEKVDTKRPIENVMIKKESLEAVGEETEEEEPSLSKLSGGRAMKTYSKKQNAAVDSSEAENETSGETADHRAWKKSIMLVYSRLATHKYASIFLRPITEDQAPGYHSIIFRPMDLWTIKKNIDNGTIRSTANFKRDVMLMFQNAIMFNKYNTLVHKMSLEMQEDCLQHMQILVQAAGEASFKRETRTAASISNEAADINLKRKWTHLTSSPHEAESFRVKKRRKSEND